MRRDSLVLDLCHGPRGSAKIQSPRSLAQYDSRTVQKERNEIERLFRRLKGFRRIFSRFEKLDIIFSRLYQFRPYRQKPLDSVNTP